MTKAGLHTISLAASLLKKVPGPPQGSPSTTRLVVPKFEATTADFSSSHQSPLNFLITPHCPPPTDQDDGCRQVCSEWASHPTLQSTGEVLVYLYDDAGFEKHRFLPIVQSSKLDLTNNSPQFTDARWTY